MDLEYLHKIDDIDNLYFLFQKVVNDILDLVAPVKETESRRKHAPLPWFDRDLMMASRKCEKLYKKSKNLPENRFVQSIYLSSRSDYQRLLRKKKIDFFKDKTASNFKRVEIFGHFIIQH